MAMAPDGLDFKHLKTLILAGEAVSQALIDRYLKTNISFMDFI